MKEKIVKQRRGDNFFYEVVLRMKKSGVVDSKQFRNIVSEVNIELGYKTIANSCVYRFIDRIEDILLPIGLMEKVPNGLSNNKKGKKANTFLYSISKEADEESIKKTIKNYFFERKSEHFKKISETKNANAKPKEKKEVVAKGRKPSKEVFAELYTILDYLYRNNKSEISRKEVIDLIGVRNYGENNVNSYIKSFGNIGIKLNISYFSGGYGSTRIIFNSVEANLLDIKRVAEKYGYKLVSLSGKLENINPNKGRVKPILIKVDGSELNHRALYAIGGIIMKNSSHRAVNIDVMCKLLNEYYNISMTKRDVMDLVKNSDGLLAMTQDRERVGIVNEKSWPEIKQQYGPSTWIRSVIARISLPITELTKRFKEVEKLSEISKDDAIYQITFEDSKHSLKEWTILYRKFRGSDQIFDKSFQEEIEKEIERIDVVSFSGVIAYEIEEDKF